MDCIFTAPLPVLHEVGDPEYEEEVEEGGEGAGGHPVGVHPPRHGGLLEILHTLHIISRLLYSAGLWKVSWQPRAGLGHHFVLDIIQLELLSGQWTSIVLVQ